jgi:hypothetical protein
MKVSRFAFIVSMILYLSSCSYLPEEQIVSDVLGVYETRDYIEIALNSGRNSETGLVFYPGGLVDPHAYIEPLSRFAVSGAGHKIIIVKMPGNLAVFDKSQGAYVFEDFPSIERWVIGGHSLGGAMACEAVKKYPDYFVGLVLMAAYPQQKTDLSEWEGGVLSLVGDSDMILDQGIIETMKPNLPDSAVYHTIIGGNHSYFGHYGLQDGDGQGSLNREQQTLEVVKQMQKFFNDNGWD